MELVLLSIMGDCVCKIVCWHGFYLLLGLCVSWLVVTGVGFIFGSWVLGLVLGLLFGGYVWCWVCLFVGW